MKKVCQGVLTYSKDLGILDINNGVIEMFILSSSQQQSSQSSSSNSVAGVRGLEGVV
jgi:hypothetical protein